MPITCKAAVTDWFGSFTNTYTINNLDKAFADMLTGKNAKGVIVFE